jgi:hypothetical protein
VIRLLSTLWLVILGYSAALGAAPETWVSGTGVDAGSCHAAAPCRTLQYALSRTRAGGIIRVQSSGSFPGVNITKSVTIVADGVVATVRTPANCGAVICVNIDNGGLILRGLIIDPMGNGSDGITLRKVNVFHLKDSVIRQSRIGLLSKTRGTSFEGILEVSTSIITGNELGIRIIANGDPRIALDRVRMHNNARGVMFDDSAGGGTVTATVTDSVIAGHAGYGVYAVTTSPLDFPGQPKVSVTLDRTAILDNGQGIWSNGEGAHVRIASAALFVRDSRIAAKGHAVTIAPRAGSQRIVLDGRLLHSSLHGLVFSTFEAAGSSRATMRKSLISRISGSAIIIDTGGGSVPADLMLDRTVLTNNNHGIDVRSGQNATIRVGDSVFSGQNSEDVSGGSVVSYGTNMSAHGSLGPIIPLK